MIYIRKNDEAKKRYECAIPPGYKDLHKKGPAAYGDAIAWFQLLDYAKTIDKPLILVTRDTKEDWWWEHDGKTLGPRHELIQEMVDTNTRFYMYTTERFMEYAQTHFHLDAKPEVIEEVKYMAVSACEACGKRYGSDEWEMVDITGLDAAPSLCGTCATLWNERRARRSPETAADDYEQFKRERSHTIGGISEG